MLRFRHLAGLGLASLTATLSLPAALDPGPPVWRDPFTHDLRQWSLEQAPGGRAYLQDGAMVIEDAGGTTLWFRERLTAPLEITYEAEVVVRGGPLDRLSDLNCFWLAQDPTQPAGALPSGRTGKFSDYDNLLTYYVGYGGNNNTTTRFRRYDGKGERPLLPESDLRAVPFLLVANHVYHVRIVATGGTTEFWRDGERVFYYADSQPLSSGYFAFRTVRSHLVIRNFSIRSLPPQP
jgi:hypothetical protein